MLKAGTTEQSRPHAPGASPMRAGPRTIRLGFVLVVALMASGAGFTLWSGRSAASRIEELVAVSLERERLIGLLQLDAALLVQAADDRLSSSSEEVRTRADRAMDTIFEEIQDISERYHAGLPRKDKALWERLSTGAERLMRKVDSTIKAANRREAERARQHLEEEARPLSLELMDVAALLGRKNAELTRALLSELQSLREKTATVGAGVLALATLLSMGVARQVGRVLRQNERIIHSQLEELSRRNSELDSFASRVAHDLVSPLAPLKGYLTLARRQSEDAEVRALLTHAEAATSRMSEFVDGLLRFCRAGKATERARGELDTAVATVLLEQAQAANLAQVVLERELERDVTVACPTHLLGSVAQNVVSNAVKYSSGSASAKVLVSVRRDERFGTLEVGDNGPGIAPEALKGLFTPFFRAAETAQRPGSGLGLATTKRLVEAHGGTIAVSSTLGKGTTVRVRFPLIEDEPNAPAARAHSI